jgi:hypothetical protein
VMKLPLGMTLMPYLLHIVYLGACFKRAIILGYPCIYRECPQYNPHATYSLRFFLFVAG